MTESSIVAQGYDAVYEAMPRSPTLLSIWKEIVAGDDYPDDFYHISFVTLADLQVLANALELNPGDNFCDAACGMGGPGLWVAREKSAHLFGVDISQTAIVQATKRAVQLGLESLATFTVCSFAQTGLEAASVDGVMTLDALQYAPSKVDALREFARILKPGGRLAFCAFELDPDKTEGLPVLGEDPVSDYRPLLPTAGFRILKYEETPNWHERVTNAFSAVIDAQPVLMQEMGTMAAAALMSEMTLTLERDFYCGRVFAVAERV